MRKTRSIRLRSTSPVWTAGAGASLFFGWPIALVIIGGILVVCALAGIFAVMIRRNEPDDTPSAPFTSPPSGPGSLSDDNAGHPDASDAKATFSPLPSDAFSGIHEANPSVRTEEPESPPEPMPEEAAAAARDAAPNEGPPEETPDVPPAAAFAAEAASVPEAGPLSLTDTTEETDPGDSPPSLDDE
jgi:hypothetical protein